VSSICRFVSLSPLFLARSLCSVPFLPRDCLDKDTKKAKSAFAPRKKKKKKINDSSIYIPFPYYCARLDRYTRAHQGAQKHTQRGKQKRVREILLIRAQKRGESRDRENHTPNSVCFLEKKCARLRRYREVFAPSRRLLREEEEEEARERSVALFQINRTKTRKLLLHHLLLLHPLKSATGERTARLRRRLR